MTSQVALEDMLKSCTLRLDTGDGPQGTAFFVTPRWAITAAHVVNGTKDIRVQLTGRLGAWSGHVQDVRPAIQHGSAVPTGLFPPPDIALIQVADGLAHSCVLLGDQKIAAGSPAMAFGHSLTLDGETVTAESEFFTVTGELETSDPGCTLLKLGLGQAVKGMSGAPVLSLSTGEVIGMLRSSRDPRTSLGAWIVPAVLIRALWPHVGGEHDRFHEVDRRWRWMSRRLAGSGSTARTDGSPEQRGGVTIGGIYGDAPVTVITDSQFRDVNIGGAGPSDSPRDDGGQGAR